MFTEVKSEDMLKYLCNHNLKECRVQAILHWLHFSKSLHMRCLEK